MVRASAVLSRACYALLGLARVGLWTELKLKIAPDNPKNFAPFKVVRQESVELILYN